MIGLLKNLFVSGPFIPHGHCYLWQPELVWLHILSDSLIALAYYSIPITLVYFVRQRQDLPFNWIFLLFGTFIVACGTTHLMEIWTLWHPTYWLSGFIKAMTAMASVYTALELVPLVPKALALPSPAQLEVTNRELQHQVRERQRAESALQSTNEELETRVKNRTSELAVANEELKTEIAERKQAKERLQTLSGKLIEAQEIERRHLARELHDEIGQALTAVKINLQTLQHSPDKNKIASSVQDSISIVEVALQQVRSLSLDLRPSLLDDLGLVAALRWYVDRQSQRGKITGELIVEPLEIKLLPNLETTCFRIVQEALTNIVRHAKAQKVTVELRQQETQLQLIIRDDGIGFDVQAARKRATQGGSLGLLGMEERVLLVGGQINIKSVHQCGSEVHVILPLASHQS